MGKKKRNPSTAKTDEKTKSGHLSGQSGKTDKANVKNKTMHSPVNSPGTQTKRQPWLHLAVLAGLLIIAAVIYARTQHYGFVLDDKIVYSGNEYVNKGWAGMGEIFGNDSFKGYFKTQKNLLSGARYRPLSLATFAAEVGLWGGSAGTAHTINWILYALNAFFVYILVLKAFSQRMAMKTAGLLAGFAALLFLLHPTHVEAVANIKGRDEILCLTLALISMIALFNWVEKGRLVSLIWAGITFLLSLFSKESSIIMPFVVPLGIFAVYGSHRKNEIKKSLFLFSTMAAVYLVVRYIAVGYLFSSGQGTEDRVLLNNPYLGLSWFEKLPNVFNIITEYIRLSIFPHPLTHDYYPWQIPLQSWSSPGAWLGILASVCLVIWVVKSIQKSGMSAFALVWIALSIGLICNLFINVGTTMNERFLYFASFGIVFLWAWLLYKSLASRFIKWPAIVLTAGLMIFYSVKSYQRVPAWADDFSLNQSGVAGSPNSARANLFMGVSYFNKYQAEKDPALQKEYLAQAKTYITKATFIIPDYADALNMRTGVAAELYKSDNDLTALLGEFQVVMVARPATPYAREYLQYLARLGHESDVVPMLVNVIGQLRTQGRSGDAVALHQFASGLFPDNATLASMAK